MANSGKSYSDCGGLENATERDRGDEYIPSWGAVLLAAVVVLGSLLILGVAILEITHSRGWELAPVILQRALR
jgi:hypothetical protein